jgi:hypothetical protein
MDKLVTEFTSDSHLQGNRYFRVVHGKTDKPHSVGLHRHDFIEIFWVRNGGGILISGGKVRKFSKNFLYISKPNEVHVLEAEKNTQMHFTYVAVARGVMEKFINETLAEEAEFSKEQFTGLSLKLSPFETSYLDRAASELAWQNDSLVAILRFLTNLYWQLRNAFASALPEMPDWLSDACQRIRNPENLALGLPKFREICDKDMSYINRAMRKYLNSTPTEFINDARLRYAAWLLETSSYPTSDISEICGFSDLPYFCRKFKEKYEYTPTQFRKNALNAAEKSDINYSYKMKNIKRVKA